MDQKLTEIAVSTEWKWACEHWYVFLIGAIIIVTGLFIAGCMKAGSESSRAEERIHESEEYRQSRQEHGDK